jgi:N-acetylmuramoyl-L-alanine amidase
MPMNHSTFGAGLNVMYVALCAALLLTLSGCMAGRGDSGSGEPRIDTRHQSLNHDSRARYIILHYTQETFERSLEILTRGRVSSHYLVSDTAKPRSYRLVAEDRRAWHAGQSFWQGESALNASSIGIEIVNLGPTGNADGSFHPYPQSQIDEVIRLVRDIAQRHQVAPHRILGHSDIAPQRKIDPGPQFPWRQFFEAGLVPWPDEAQVHAALPDYTSQLPDVVWYQSQLADYGFQVPRTGLLDPETRRVISNFQAKYRPSRHDGEPDAETAAILAVLARPEGRVMRQADGSVAVYRWRDQK